MAQVFSHMETTTMGVVPIGFGIMGILLDVAPAQSLSLESTPTFNLRDYSVP
jgi:hypothetical protein